MKTINSMNTRESAPYSERLDILLSPILGNNDIYDFHINNNAEKEQIVEDLTKGSVRLQSGMIVSVPESDRIEYDFIYTEMP